MKTSGDGAVREGGTEQELPEGGGGLGWEAMASALLEEREDGWHIALRGWRVDRCSFDYQTRLLLFYSPDDKLDEGFEIILGTTFELVRPGKEGQRLDPQGPHDTLGPVIGLFQANVEEALVERSGTLSVTFHDGSRLRCEPNPDYEAWELSGPGGLLIVCIPVVGNRLSGTATLLPDRKEARGGDEAGA
jgi:uncharacterized protein DUF6188